MSRETLGVDFSKVNCALKRSAILSLVEHSPTFYLHCVAHPQLSLGRRKLTGREEQDGILLVFGPHSYRSLTLDKRFLCCELQFQRWETITIPLEAISRSFDKSSHVVMQWMTLAPTIEVRKKRTPYKIRGSGKDNTYFFPPKKKSDTSLEKGLSNKKKEKKEKKVASRVIEVDFSRN